MRKNCYDDDEEGIDDHTVSAFQQLCNFCERRKPLNSNSSNFASHFEESFRVLCLILFLNKRPKTARNCNIY
jgi:hypothetical protein